MKIKPALEYDIVYPAYKCNMTDITAAIGLKQLERYEGLLKRRHDIIDRYNAAGRRWPFLTTGTAPTFSATLPCAHPGLNAQRRNAVITEMKTAPPVCPLAFLPMMTAYKNLPLIYGLPNAYAQYENHYPAAALPSLLTRRLTMSRRGFAQPLEQHRLGNSRCF